MCWKRAFENGNAPHNVWKHVVLPLAICQKSWATEELQYIRSALSKRHLRLKEVKKAVGARNNLEAWFEGDYSKGVLYSSVSQCRCL